MTSISTSGTPAAPPRRWSRRESTATVTRAPCCGEHAEPGRVGHLVGQQEVLAQTGARHALHLAHGGAGEPRVARRRLALASAVHLCAFTCGRSRRPGERLRHGAQVVLEQTRVDQERRRGQLRRLHARTLPTDGARASGRSGTLRRVSTAVAGGRLRPGRRVPGQGAVAAGGPRRLHRRHAASPLNAFSHTDFERARESARRADVSLPFGGVPFGVKELEKVEGWPYTEASVIFRDRVADHDDTSLSRLARHRRGAGGPDDGTGVRRASTAPRPSCTGRRATRGIKSAPRAARRVARRRRSPAVCCRSRRAATAAGPSRGPAGFSGLFGLKATYGRIPKGTGRHD